MLSHDELVALSKTDIKDVNPVFLKDITKLTIDPNIPLKEKIEQYLAYVKNPYLFLVDDTVVKISYNNHNNLTLDKCLHNYLVNKQKSDEI